MRHSKKGAVHTISLVGRGVRCWSRCELADGFLFCFIFWGVYLLIRPIWLWDMITIRFVLYHCLIFTSKYRRPESAFFDFIFGLWILGSGLMGICALRFTLLSFFCLFLFSFLSGDGGKGGIRGGWGVQGRATVGLAFGR